MTTPPPPPPLFHPFISRRIFTSLSVTTSTLSASSPLPPLSFSLSLHFSLTCLPILRRFTSRPVNTVAAQTWCRPRPCKAWNLPDGRRVQNIPTRSKWPRMNRSRPPASSFFYFTLEPFTFVPLTQLSSCVSLCFRICVFPYIPKGLRAPYVCKLACLTSNFHSMQL